MSKRSLYVVCQTLDQPIRVIGFTLDEFIPAVVVGIVFLVVGKTILSLLLFIGVIILLRILKKGKGMSWLLSCCYWYLPPLISACFLRKTPPAHDRDWIA